LHSEDNNLVVTVLIRMATRYCM